MPVNDFPEPSDFVGTEKGGRTASEVELDDLAVRMHAGGEQREARPSRTLARACTPAPSLIKNWPSAVLAQLSSQTPFEWPGQTVGMLEGAAMGLNRLTLTSFRPPETIGVSGLPPFRPPVWPQADTLYCWDPAFLNLFQPALGFPALHAARDFFIARMEELGFKVDSDFDENGMAYHFCSTSGDE